METNAVSADAVKDVLVETLELQDRADEIGADTQLMGALPELDSMAVLELILALEQRFGITVPEEDVSAEAFATLGSLTELVERARG
jgi:acyl carrier protein